jgi:RimJ/RimL family protein N-acetyltransferase
MELMFVEKSSKDEVALLFCPPLDEQREAKTFVDWFNDNRVRQYLGRSSGMSESGELGWIHGQDKKPDDLIWFVYVDGQPIGSIGLHRIDRTNAQAEMGINIGDKSRWGKGIATAMEIAVLDYAFSNIVAGGLHKVFVRVFTKNIASKKVIQDKIGFREIGVRREDVWCNGGWYDTWLGEMLQCEWLERRDENIKKAGILRLDLYPGIEP